MSDEKKESPNKDIDTAIKAMLKSINARAKNAEGGEFIPNPDDLKILNTAIAWEKAKHHIQEQNDDFNPDNI